MEKPLQGFPTAIKGWWQRWHPAVWQMELLVSLSPACPCCCPASAIEGLGRGDQHPLPTRAVLCSCPMPWHPSRDGDAPARPNFTAWATGGPRHPSSEPLLPSDPD